MTTRSAPPLRVPHRTWHGDLLVASTGGTRLRTTRRTLGRTLAAYVAVLDVLAALGGGAVLHPAWRVDWRLGSAACLVAAAQALPIGYFLAFANRRPRSIVVATAAGALLGALLAAVGALGGAALTALVPVAAAIGAAIGSAAFIGQARRARARALNEAAVIGPDLPLVGGVYLLTPLLWLAADGAARDADGPAVWPVLLLGLYGASLLASARASRGTAGGRAHAHGALAGGWFLLASAPFWARWPTMGAAAAAVVAAFAAAHEPLLRDQGRDRRMEGPAVRRALPFLLVYLALLATAPVAAALAGQSGRWLTWAAIASASTVGTGAQLVAACVTLGYAAGELRARADDRVTIARRRVVSWTMPILAVAVAVAGQGLADAALTWRSAAAALAVGGLGLAGARLGVSIFTLQRAHARAYARERSHVRTVADGAGAARRVSPANRRLAASRSHSRRPVVDA